MKQLFFLLLAGTILWSCKPGTKKFKDPYEHMIALLRDTTNVVKMTDSLVIFESTCRGCAYEGSTHFDITDSLGIIQLASIRTIDNNSPDMSGGNVSKDLILVPVKPGLTTIKLYKFWKEPATAEDSAHYTTYTIDVRN